MCGRYVGVVFFFFSSRRRHTRSDRDWSSDVCSSDLINRARANARKAEAEGEAAFVRVTGEAEGSRRRAIGLGDAAAVEALGLAKAKGYEAQVQSLGSTPTAAVAIANALSEGKLDVVPEVLVTGGGGALEGLAATFMRSLNGNGQGKAGTDKPVKGGR